MKSKKDQYIEWGRVVVEKEIAALSAAEGLMSADFARAVELAARTKGRVVVTGLGKSGHIGAKIAATMSSLGTPAAFMHSAEALHGDLGALRAGDTLVAISHSGGTPEVVAAAEAAAAMGLPVIAITNGPASRLARLSSAVLLTGASEEADHLNLAPTCSSTVTLAIGDALAVAASRARGFERKDFANLHPGGALGKKARRKN